MHIRTSLSRRLQNQYGDPAIRTSYGLIGGNVKNKVQRRVAVACDKIRLSHLLFTQVTELETRCRVNAGT
jgi:hypothetical protein